MYIKDVLPWAFGEVDPCKGNLRGEGRAFD